MRYHYMGKLVIEHLYKEYEKDKIICCFTTDSAIKGNTIFTCLSLSNFCQNTISVLGNKLFVKSIVNSILVSVTSAILSCFSAAMFGYYLCLERNVKRTLNIVLYAIIGIPSVVLLVPTFFIYKSLGMLNTYTAIIISSMTIPFLCVVFKENIENFPLRIIDTAKTDGASNLVVFFHIYLPQLRYVILSSILISFFESWNSVLYPAVILYSEDKFTNAVFLSSMSSLFFNDYAVLMTCWIYEYQN